MGWSEWSYYKKWRVIGIIVGVILSLIPWILFSISCSILTCPIELFNIAGSNCSSILSCFSFGGLISIILFVIFLFLMALFGALVGWLVRLINKNLGMKGFLIWGLSGGIILFVIYYLVAMFVESINLVGKWQINLVVFIIGVIIGNLIKKLS